MPARDSKPPARGGTNRTVPRFRTGEDVVFKFSGNLSGVVRDVKVEGERVTYSIYATFAFEVSEDAVQCRTVEAERVIGTDVLRDKGKRW
ncbi:MAG TPA: hypothetical protein VGB98_10830 [Pyrinomonadaceae bacterium]|jgi:hypothetical protein